MMNGLEVAVWYNVNGEVPLLSVAWIERFADKQWQPTKDDRLAAGKLHAQIVSRITVQPLNYLHGVEVTALESVYSLFPKTREIVDVLPNATSFEALAWDVLNVRVRPFTAKWHRKSQAGALSALDTTDEFRAELADLQGILRRFDRMLLDLRDNAQLGPAAATVSKPTTVAAPTSQVALPWGISSPSGGIGDADVKEINDVEREAVLARRKFYDLPNLVFATGLAISGGGIRSATFGLGVLAALARRGVLPQVDYLSTVSGGGYLGAFLSAYLSSPGHKEEIGLCPEQLPFRKDNGEAAALRHVRHHSRYLAAGTWWQQLTIAVGQLYGMTLNMVAVVYVAAMIAFFEFMTRDAGATNDQVRQVMMPALALLGVGAMLTLLIQRFSRRLRDKANAFVAAPTVIVVVFLLWLGLGAAHDWFESVWTKNWKGVSIRDVIAALGAIPIASAGISRLARPLWKRIGRVFIMLLVFIAAPAFFFGIYLLLYQVMEGASLSLIVAALIIATVIYIFVLDVNATSLHGMYRNKLSRAYILRAPHTKQAAPEGGASILLSDLSGKADNSAQAGPAQSAQWVRAPYHLINCALNVPGSKNTAMHGRLTDFFVFSAAYCGSPSTGYSSTKVWEATNPQLDLATAMAVSGAAAAPQMGLGTIKRASFWLALLNVRLGVWIRKPRSGAHFGLPPGLQYLLKEMLGTMSEKSPYLYVTDGGHIENLGIYELLRRRCKYIIAIDGEQDAGMTFHGLTTLQRLAAIDLDITIDVDLDDLRLTEKGLSRSHFRLCRIHYGKENGVERTGTLLYVKLSITGNEGEFLRRYRLDEPAFPHHSTGDQFFDETQFEAYRTLGEHVGDKLFLKAIVGDLADPANHDVNVVEWFDRLERQLLEPQV